MIVVARLKNYKTATAVNNHSTTQLPVLQIEKEFFNHSADPLILVSG